MDRGPGFPRLARAHSLVAGSCRASGPLAAEVAVAKRPTTRAALLTSVSARDVDLRFRASANKAAAGNAQYIYGVVRRVSATAEYRAKLRFAPNGSVFVQGTVVSNNA